MRRLRAGTWNFLTTAGLGMGAALVAGGLAGGWPRLAQLAGYLVVAVFGTLAVLTVMAGRKRKRLQAVVSAGQAQWAAESLVFAGDELIPGNHLPIGPPGPKGVLILRGRLLTWTPDGSTSQKGYRPATFNVDTSRAVFEGSTRDVTGLRVNNWAFHIEGSVLRLQVFAQTSDLAAALADRTGPSGQ